MKNRLLTITSAAIISITPLAAQTPERPEAIRVGSYEVYVLQENANPGKTNILIGAPPEALVQYAPGGTYPTAVNAVLIRKDDRVWLVDTGLGQTIFEKMAALGIEPADVNEVLLTHMHSDHIGGMLLRGIKAFPNATVGLSQREHDYWSSEQNAEAKQVLSEYDDMLNLLAPLEISDAMPNGITPITAYGHTPGHTMFMIRDGSHKLLIWGDLTHAMAIQMPYPEVSVRYDIDPDAARKSRLNVLRHVASAKIPVLGMHVPATLPGRVKAEGNGYLFQTLSSK
jgi:glyoxylase-like metal-dependent hydrolase (beta-lactamase superfamily II)